MVFCSGKVVWDALAERDKRQAAAAIVRVEQLYPFPEAELQDILSRRYPNIVDAIWCQEEPMNQGAWYAKHHRLERLIKKGQTLDAVARASSPSPAVGYAAKHAQQQKEVVNAALGIKE